MSLIVRVTDARLVADLHWLQTSGVCHSINVNAVVRDVGDRALDVLVRSRNRHVLHKSKGFGLANSSPLDRGCNRIGELRCGVGQNHSFVAQDFETLVVRKLFERQCAGGTVVVHDKVSADSCSISLHVLYQKDPDNVSVAWEGSFLVREREQVDHSANVDTNNLDLASNSSGSGSTKGNAIEAITWRIGARAEPSVANCLTLELKVNKLDFFCPFAVPTAWCTLLREAKRWFTVIGNLALVALTRSVSFCHFFEHGVCENKSRVRKKAVVCENKC